MFPPPEISLRLVSLRTFTASSRGAFRQLPGAVESVRVCGEQRRQRVIWLYSITVYTSADSTAGKLCTHTVAHKPEVRRVHTPFKRRLGHLVHSSAIVAFYLQYQMTRASYYLGADIRC